MFQVNSSLLNVVFGDIYWKKYADQKICFAVCARFSLLSHAVPAHSSEYNHKGRRNPVWMQRASTSLFLLFLDLFSSCNYHGCINRYIAQIWSQTSISSSNRSLQKGLSLWPLVVVRVCVYLHKNAAHFTEEGGGIDENFSCSSKPFHSPLSCFSKLGWDVSHTPSYAFAPLSEIKPA